jgi:hypothetical protein
MFVITEFVVTEFIITEFVVTEFVITEFVITEFVITKFVITEVVMTEFVITELFVTEFHCNFVGLFFGFNMSSEDRETSTTITPVEEGATNSEELKLKIETEKEKLLKVNGNFLLQFEKHEGGNPINKISS